MKPAKPSNIDEVLFEPKDMDVFRVPDNKTRAAAVRSYLFPRMEFLLRHAVEKVSDVYGVTPLDPMTVVWRPQNRPEAVKTQDFQEAYMGLGGKRQFGRPLAVFRRDGAPFSFHPSRLIFVLLPDARMVVCLQPFVYCVDDDYIRAFAEFLRQHESTLAPLLMSSHVSYPQARSLATPHEAVDAFARDRRLFPGPRFYSPSFHLPVDAKRGLTCLVWAFVAMYPLLDALTLIAEGSPPRFTQMMDKYKEWMKAVPKAQNSEAPEDTPAEACEALAVDRMDSYHMMRPGVWWRVLSRDGWTCRSCGRTPKDGVSLQVDHVVPRSKGGTDDPSNLQALCRKCNIGKSNRDATDLSAI